MASLMKCRTCSGTVSSNAKKCPHCGEDKPTEPGLLSKIVAIAILVVIGKVIMLFGDDGADKHPPTKLHAEAIQGSHTTTGETVISTSIVYQEGQQDRRRWEAWFNAQSGDFKLGADWWASHRSDDNPGSCSTIEHPQASSEWLYGCSIAGQMLAQFDKRRKTEPDYRRGFNARLP